LDLEVFAKVSGSKGVQLYVPLNVANATYAVAQAFAKTIAELMAERYPDLVVSKMTKARRPGKVFIDWSQNSDFKTTVGVYSLRAKLPKPYVSMPVRWEELEAAVKSDKADSLYFKPDAALTRLKKIGDLFGPVLKLQQKLPKEFVKKVASVPAP